MHQHTDLSHIQPGINTMMQLIGLMFDPVHEQFILDEQDIVLATSSIKQAFGLSKRMVGKQQHINVEFNYINYIKRDMLSFLTAGADDEQSRVLRKQNLPLYYMVIEPTIDVMSQWSHVEALANVNTVVDQVVEMIKQTTNAYGTHEQGLQARQRIQQIIVNRNAIAASKQSKRVSKAEKLIESLLTND